MISPVYLLFQETEVISDCQKLTVTSATFVRTNGKVRENKKHERTIQKRHESLIRYQRQTK